MVASLPPSAPLAAVVPNFPRIGGQPVRDWIGQAVENLPGFNGNDLARLLLPDLVGLVVSLGSEGAGAPWWALCDMCMCRARETCRGWQEGGDCRSMAGASSS